MKRHKPATQQTSSNTYFYQDRHKVLTSEAMKQLRCSNMWRTRRTASVSHVHSFPKLKLLA